MLRLIFLTLTLLTTSHAYSGQTVKVDPLRLVSLVGEVDGSTLAVVSRIERLADGSGKPIYLLINSPGGSVAIGAQVLSVMQAAQKRGHTIKCYVPLVAASMGFQILAKCNERYAFKYTLLLWHPMKANLDASTSDEMLYFSKRLRAWEKPFIDELLVALKISPETFFYHYRNETLWMAHEFNNLSPNFVNIVDDIAGVPDLFSLDN